jgi:hypothetical protein
VPPSCDPVRGRPSPTDDCAVRRSLPPGAESSGNFERTDRGCAGGRYRRSNSSASAPRRIAQLLRSRGMMIAKMDPTARLTKSTTGSSSERPHPAPQAGWWPPQLLLSSRVVRKPNLPGGIVGHYGRSTVRRGPAHGVNGECEQLPSADGFSRLCTLNLELALLAVTETGMKPKLANGGQAICVCVLGVPLPPTTVSS